MKEALTAHMPRRIRPSGKVRYKMTILTQQKHEHIYYTTKKADSIENRK